MMGGRFSPSRRGGDVPRGARVLMVRCLFGFLLAVPSATSAQTPELDQSRQRLDSIRIERERLESESRQLESQVKDVGAELRNLDAQRRSTNRIVNEIDRQIGGLNTQVDRVSADLVLTQDNLAETRAILERRLIDIAKRGALYVWQVLLTADSFGDLISRYKYLYLTNLQDQALMVDVEHLRDRVTEVRAASMERREGQQFDFNDPRLETALDRAVKTNRTVIVGLLFLAPGQHAGPRGDIEAICRKIERRSPGSRILITGLAGGHPDIIDILADRVREAEEMDDERRTR